MTTDAQPGLALRLTALAAAGCMQLAGRHMTRWTSLSFGPFLALGLLATTAIQQHGLDAAMAENSRDRISARIDRIADVNSPKEA